MSGTATLDSSWLDVRFSNASLFHHDGNLPVSHATGSGRVTWGEKYLTYDLALQAQPLSFTALQHSYPMLPLRGSYAGGVQVKGTSPNLLVNTNLSAGQVKWYHFSVGGDVTDSSGIYIDIDSALSALSGNYEYIVIDCPPSLGLLTINALVAAARVLVPLQCEFYALEGLTHLLKTVKLVRERLNAGLKVDGIVLTMFDGRTSLALQIRDEVQRYFPGEIFETVIPRNVRLTEAPSHGKPVMLHDLKSQGSIAYLELTREVLTHE